MLLAPFLLVAFAVASVLKKPEEFSKTLPRGSGLVNVTEYYHPSWVKYRHFRTDRLTKSLHKPWAILEISKYAIGRSWSKAVSLTGGIFLRSVHFLALFQIPLDVEEVDKDGTVTVYFTFSYTPGMKYYWDADVSVNPTFKNERTTFRTKSSTQALYKVVGRPGGLFPLRLTVLNVQQAKFFRMEWALDPASEARMPLESQLVRMEYPEILSRISPIANGNLPTEGDYYVPIPLRPSFESIIIKEHAFRTKDSNLYILKGTYLPQPGLNRFVLSSEVPIVVQIYPSLEEKKFHTLGASKGYASEIELPLSSTGPYRVFVSVILEREYAAGFSLQAYNPRNASQSSYVMIQVPLRENEPVKLHEPTADVVDHDIENSSSLGLILNPKFNSQDLLELDSGSDDEGSINSFGDWSILDSEFVADVLAHNQNENFGAVVGKRIAQNKAQAKSELS